MAIMDAPGTSLTNEFSNLRLEEGAASGSLLEWAQGVDVLQWNCRKLHTKLRQVAELVERHEIRVLAFSEAALPKGSALDGYRCLSCPSVTTFLPNGSAMLYIRKGVEHRKLDTKTLRTESFEAVAAKVHLRGMDVTILSVYARSGNYAMPLEELKRWCSTHNSRLVVCGDFNCHHRDWGSKKTDARGRRLNEAMTTLGLELANDGRPTRCQQPSGYSTLDLTFHSAGLCLRWDPAPVRMGSDHYPLAIRIRGDTRVQGADRPDSGCTVF